METVEVENVRNVAALEAKILKRISESGENGHFYDGLIDFFKENLALHGVEILRVRK